MLKETHGTRRNEQVPSGDEHNDCNGFTDKMIINSVRPVDARDTNMSVISTMNTMRLNVF